MSYILHTSSPSLKEMTEEVVLSSFPDTVIMHELEPCSTLLERVMQMVKYIGSFDDVIVVHSFINTESEETVFDSYPTVPGKYIMTTMRCVIGRYGKYPSDLLLCLYEDKSRIFKVLDDGTKDFGFGYDSFKEYVDGLMSIGESEHGIAMHMGLASNATTFAMYSIPLSILPACGTVLNNIRGNVEFPFTNTKGVLENA